MVGQIGFVDPKKGLPIELQQSGYIGNMSYLVCFVNLLDSVWFSSTHKRLFYKIKKRVTETITLSSGGRGWIRTTEVIDDRFTVCSLWPLGNSSILFGEITEVISLWSW